MSEICMFARSRIVYSVFAAGMLATWLSASRADDLPAVDRLPPPNCFTFWQLPSQTGSQIMSYVIQSPHGQVIVVDGGFTGDAPYLRNFVTNLGGTVHAWFLSHQHIDHIGAITAVLANPGPVEIEKTYASLLSEPWLKQYEPNENDTMGPARELNAALAAAGKSVSPLSEGQEIVVDGLHIEVLLAADESQPSENAVNNQSVVLRLSTPGTSVIFLGDLGVEGGERLLQGKSAAKLPSEYVQMAHHGQAGVDRPVYAAIQPKYALWPTPDWLWTWDTTKEVRGWMKELGVQENYVLKDGLIELNLPMLASESGQK